MASSSTSSKRKSTESSKDASKRKSTESNKDGGSPSKKTKTSSSFRSKDNDKSRFKKDYKKPQQQPQKQVTKQERQSTRKHADVVIEAKEIWNQLRLKTNTKEQTKTLVKKLMSVVEGKAKAIAMQHDAARVIQAAMQFGTPAHRLLLVTELTATPGSLAELSKDQYAHFCVLKMIKYCKTDTKEALPKIMKNLQGHLASMAVHAVAATVVDALWTNLSSKYVHVLRQELYGPHFGLFATTTTTTTKDAAPSNKDAAANAPQKKPSLADCLKAAPEKKEFTTNFVKRLIAKCMEKNLYGFSYVQELLADYFDVLLLDDDSHKCYKEIRAIVQAGGAENAIHLLASRAGTRCVCHMVAYGTAKDRKAMLKSLKGHARTAVLQPHSSAYLAIVRLVQCTDDTVTVHKMLLQELYAPLSLADNKNDDDDEEEEESPLLEIATSETGCKLLQFLLVDDDEARLKCFDPYERSVLFENPTIVLENGEREPTSKKEESAKRHQLFEHVREPLVAACVRHAEELLRSRSGSAVLREVYQTTHSQELVRAVVEACRRSLDPNSGVGDDGEQEDSREVDADKRGDDFPLLEDRVGHLAVKNLLLVDAAPEAKQTPFADAFLDQFDDLLTDLAKTNRGAFVVAALCKVASQRKRAVAKLDKKQLKRLQKEESKTTAGLAALLKEMES